MEYSLVPFSCIDRERNRDRKWEIVVAAHRSRRICNYDGVFLSSFKVVRKSVPQCIETISGAVVIEALADDVVWIQHSRLDGLFTLLYGFEERTIAVSIMAVECLTIKNVSL